MREEYDIVNLNPRKNPYAKTNKDRFANLIDATHTQTEYAILFFLNAYGAQCVSELMDRTGYPRDTVNGTLKRLVDKGMIDRDMGNNGKLEYYVNPGYIASYDNREKRILEYLFTNHKSAMTPNACRLIYYLLANGSYDISYLVQELNWKPAATYSCTKKLMEAGIIEKTDAGYIFTKAIQNKSRAEDRSLHVACGTLNMHCYQNEDDAAFRFSKLFPNLGKANVWCLQDVVPNAYPEMENDFKKNGYSLIFPEGYDKDIDNNCMITVLAINAEDVYDYEPLTLGDNTLFPLRYTYGTCKTWNGRSLRILNLYIPQSCNADEERKEKIKEFWKVILKEVKACRDCDEDFVLLGDLNAYAWGKDESENASSLERLSDLMIDQFEDWGVENIEDEDLDEYFDQKYDPGYTWESKEGVRKRLDYAFISTKTAYSGNVSSAGIENFPINEGISDHKALIIGLEDEDFVLKRGY